VQNCSRYIENYWFKHKNLVGCRGASPPDPPHRGLCPLDPRWGLRPQTPCAMGGCLTPNFLYPPRPLHQIVCRLGLCPRPTGELIYYRSPDPLAGLGVGPTRNGKEGGEGKRREEREGTGREGRASRMPESRVGKPNNSLPTNNYLLVSRNNCSTCYMPPSYYFWQ